MDTNITEQEVCKIEGIKLYHGIIAMLIASVFLTGIVFELDDAPAGLKEYALSFVLTTIIALLFSIILMFMINSFTALLIMLINRYFDMRQLFKANYNYYANCILATSIYLFLVLKFDAQFPVVFGNVLYCLWVLLLLRKYYSNLIQKACVNQWAARILLGITIVISLALAYLFKLS